MESDAPKDLLAELLDQLIPASGDGKIPAAGALGVARFVRENAAGSDLVTHLLARASALQRAGMAVNAAMVKQLEAEAPAAFGWLLRMTYMGYYSRPDTRVFFGLSASPVHPQGYAVADEPADMIEALVAPVRSRGDLFRDC